MEHPGGLAGTGKPLGGAPGEITRLRDGRAPTSALPVLKNGLTLAALADQTVEESVIVKGRLVVG